jgi:DNA repair exonuclease SbcCD ATPase subunit
MSDPTNDIDDIDDINALLRDLGYAASIGHRPWRHIALTALVAERDALKKRVAEQDADIKTLAASNAILHGRLESHPTADRELAAMQKQRDEARVRAAAEGANTASLLHTLALIREAGKWQKEMLSELPSAVKAMREQRDEAVELYTDLLRRLSGSASSAPPRASFLSGDAREKEGGGA